MIEEYDHFKINDEYYYKIANIANLVGIPYYGSNFYNKIYFKIKNKNVRNILNNSQLFKIQVTYGRTFTTNDVLNDNNDIVTAEYFDEEYFDQLISRRYLTTNKFINDKYVAKISQTDLVKLRLLISK